MQPGSVESNHGTTTRDPVHVADGISLAELVGMLCRRWSLIAACTALGVFLGLLLGLRSPRVYVAQVKVIPTAYLSISPDVSSLAQIRGAAAQFGLGLGGPTTNASPLFPQLLSSRDLIARILSRDYPLQDGKQVNLLGYLGIRSGDPEKVQQIAAATLRRRVVSAYDMKSGVTTISASFRDPILAAAVANAAAEELNRFLQELKTSQAGHKARFVSQRLEEVQAQLQQGEDALKTFRQQNRQVIGSPLLMLEEARLARNVSVNEQLFITLKTQLETARIEAVRDLPDIAIVEKATPPIYRSRWRRTLMIATLLFGCIGVGLAFALQRLEDYRRMFREAANRGGPPD